MYGKKDESYIAICHIVTDDELRRVVAETIDAEHPRQWFWALMDYGSYLKKQGAGSLDKSAHYKKQSVLEGSVRQVRGHIIRALTKSAMSEAELHKEVVADERFEKALASVIKDGLVSISGNQYHLTK